MTDYFNYLSENQAFQNIRQFGQQKQEAYKQEQQQGIFDIVESFPLISDTTEKVKDVYQRGQKLYKTSQEALGKLSENVQKGQEAISEGIEKVKGGISKFSDLSQEVQQKIINKSQQFRSFTEGELRGFKARYGERFNTELDNLQSAKRGLAKDLADKLAEKRSQIFEAHDQLRQQLGREPTIEERTPLQSELNKFKSDLSSQFEQKSTELENSLKSKFIRSTTQFTQDGEDLSQGIGQRISRRLNIDNFEMDPESFSPSKLSMGLGEKVSSVFRGGFTPKIPSMEVPKVSSMETPKLGLDIPKVSDLVKAEDVKGLIPKINPLEQGSKLVSEFKGDVGKIAEGVVSKGSEALAEGGEIAQKAVDIGGEVAGAVADTAETVGGLVAESIPIVGEVLGAGLALFEGLKGVFEPKPHVFSVARPSYVAGI